MNMLGYKPRGADFSPDHLHRYLLYRRWEFKVLKRILWIMLNPSTADENVDDATIRKCIGFSKLWGAQLFEVCNLFSYISTDPRALNSIAASALTDRYNDQMILSCARGASIIVAGWGNHGSIHGRDTEVLHMLKTRNFKVYCLRHNKDGSPAHPLTRNLPYTTQLQRFL